MSQLLVLRLAERMSWIITDSAGAPIGPVSTGSLADLAPLAALHPVIAIVPATSVTLAQPELPVRGGSRLAQVVPYALEETLAGDVEQFHFAIGATDDSGRTLVAAVRRDELRGWLDALAAVGIAPRALVPQTLCLPENPGKTVAVVDGGQLLVRSPGAIPVVLDAEPLTEAFSLAGLEGDDRHVQLYVTGHDWDESRDMIEALREVTGSLDLQLLPDGTLPLLAPGAARPGALSLLQAEFQSQGSWRSEWRRWRIAAALALAALALHAGVRGYELIGLRAEEQRLDAAIDQAARLALPDVERIVDVRAQIGQRLAGGGTHDPEGLLPRLAAVGGALASVPGPRLETLGWRDRVLDLQLVAADTALLGRFAEALGAQGLRAEVRSTTPQADAILGQIAVAGGGAP
jgi:general secretion pathway protein L